MIKFNIVTKLGISEVARGDKEDMKGRTKRERAKLLRIMIFVCVLFFGMSEKVVFAEEQREQNEQQNERRGSRWMRAAPFFDAHFTLILIFGFFSCSRARSDFRSVSDNCAGNSGMHTPALLDSAQNSST